jgi:hypothetical protein
MVKVIVWLSGENAVPENVRPHQFYLLQISVGPRKLTVFLLPK